MRLLRRANAILSNNDEHKPRETENGRRNLSVAQLIIIFCPNLNRFFSTPFDFMAFNFAFSFNSQIFAGHFVTIVSFIQVKNTI